MMLWPKRIKGYNILHEIGLGGFGTVYLVEHYGAEFALKQLERGIMNPEISGGFIRESKKVEKIRVKYNFDYIIKIFDILCENNSCVMEYVPESREEHFANEEDETFIIYLIKAFHLGGIAENKAGRKTKKCWSAENFANTN